MPAPQTVNGEGELQKPCLSAPAPLGSTPRLNSKDRANFCYTLPMIKPGSRAMIFVPQPRDLALLRILFESRLLTLEHAATLCFEGRGEAAKKRVQKLKAAGVIGERPRHAFAPSVLHLTRKAFTLLSQNGILAEYPPLPVTALEKRAQVSDLTLRHELEVMDAKTAVVPAIARTNGFSIAEFSTWPALYQFRAQRPDTRAEVTVKPDGFIRIREQDDGGVFEHTFFLEVDRSTETQDTLALKAACYLDYYKSGGLAVRNGQPRSAFREFPFRVLMVFKTPERRNNAAERLLVNHPPIFTQVWLTTMKELLADPLGAIWIRPADYRTATDGTPFTPEKASGFGYRRQTAREDFIEAKVRKHKLLSPEPGTGAGN